LIRLALLISFGASFPALAQDIGFEGPQYTGAGATPTESKPESKLWFNDGFWWGSLWSTSAQAFRIHRLNFATHSWIDTGVLIESRTNTHGDVLWDGTKLYIASHIFSTTGGATGNPILFSRYGYDPQADLFSRDPGFPVTIGDHSTEALVIDKDSTGTIWAAWTQGSRVRINHTLASDLQWRTPYILPRNTSSLTPDDLCSLTSFGGDRIGVLWSNQNANAYQFSFHVDGTADTSWSTIENATTGETDDHINLSVHPDGRVFVVGKNQANNLLLLARAVNGTWSRYVISQPSPILTRPALLLDEQSGTLHVFAAGQDTGEIFEKTSPISNIAFAPGTGTMRMRDASTTFRISDPTSTKQNVDAESGLVVLAHHSTTGSYWHHDVLPAAPVVDFGALPLTGLEPLNVDFIDLSTGSITLRTWSFGDGSTATGVSPSHTYMAAGTYTVSLTATGPGGSDTATKTNLIVVTPLGPVASFAAFPTVGLAPLSVDFADVSSGPITSRLWSFGDGATSTETHPSHTYSTVGDYTVNLIVTGPAGSDSETKPGFITALPPRPQGGFYAFPTTGQAPMVVQFTDASSGVITSRLWDFGDGATSAATHPLHTYSAVGSYTVSLTVEGPGGSDVETEPDFIRVLPPPPEANFTASPSSGVFPYAVNFTDASSGTITSRSWTFGDGWASAATNPSHTYDTWGTYTVSLRATGPGGSDTETKTDFVLVIPPPPKAGFMAGPTDGEALLTVTFTDQTTEPVTSWLWDFGDGTTSTSRHPVHIFRGGTYTVSLTSSGPGGTDTFTHVGFVHATQDSPVVLANVPSANFEATPTTGIRPLVVDFNDTSSGELLTRSWSFGDGATSDDSNPRHIYALPGVYTVSLTVRGSGGVDTRTREGYIVVEPPPPIITTYPVSADARVRETEPDENFGTDDLLRIRLNPDGSYHSYLRFDGIGGGRVLSAKLRLFGTDDTNFGGQVFPTSTAWSETGITWANAPAATGGLIASQGPHDEETWVEFDVTSAITGGSSVSFLLTSTTTDSAYYSSREGSDPPVLIVTFAGE
jgi:PKD repeat protein